MAWWWWHVIRFAAYAVLIYFIYFPLQKFETLNRTVFINRAQKIAEENKPLEEGLSLACFELVKYLGDREFFTCICFEGKKSICIQDLKKLTGNHFTKVPEPQFETLKNKISDGLKGGTQLVI